MTPLNIILKQNTEVTSELILELISYIDLTSLSKDDNKESIEKLIETANTGYKNTFPAAICVFSKFGELVASKLSSDIKTAVVCSNFPHGNSIQSVLNQELVLLNNSQIDEVDIIGQISLNENKSIIDLLPSKQVKTILESGELTSNLEISQSAANAINAGSQFIKTSTGTSNTGYTAEALYVMCLEIKKHYKETGIKIGIKPSGGIRTLKQATETYTIVKQILGEQWLTPKLYRIGASSLYHNLITEHQKRFPEW